MSEGASSIGQALRAAREAQGLSVEDVATRLRLMQRQIEAMEADEFDSLGQPVFARGFVRNYARLLKLPHDTLLGRMGGDTAEPKVIVQAPSLPARSWLSSPWLILILLFLVLAVAAPLGLYLWLNSDVDEAQTLQLQPAAKEAVPAVSASVTAPVPAAVARPAPAAVQQATAAAVQATPAAPTIHDPEPQSGVLRFDFGGESWVEIKDGSGRMVHRQLNTPGSQVEVTGRPPFDLVVGNAALVHMTYNGRPIDLNPYIEVTVARFSLEE